MNPNCYLCTKFHGMKKNLLVVLLIVIGLGFSSCQKSRYCQCYAIVDDETIAFGDDIDVSEMTATQLDQLEQRYKYNLFVIEREHSCDDKEKEFKGWGQVVCEEADPKMDDSWWRRLFNRDNNNNNNNNNGTNTH